MNRDYQIFDKINVNLPIIIVSQKKYLMYQIKLS